MSDTVTIRIRLHIPDGKVGEVVTVSAERGDQLVSAGYAVYEEYEVEAHEGGSVAGAKALPDVNAVKSEWVEVADSLGIETEGLTKAEIIEAVKDGDDS